MKLGGERLIVVVMLLSSRRVSFQCACFRCYFAPLTYLTRLTCTCAYPVLTANDNNISYKLHEVLCAISP
jgi:hypothetical protein